MFDIMSSTAKYIGKELYESIEQGNEVKFRGYSSLGVNCPWSTINPNHSNYVSPIVLALGTFSIFERLLILYNKRIPFSEIGQALLCAQQNQNQFMLMKRMLCRLPEPCTAEVILSLLPASLNGYQEAMAIRAARKINYIFNRDIAIEAFSQLYAQMETASLLLIEYFCKNSGKLSELFKAVSKKDLKEITTLMDDLEVVALINENYNLFEKALEVKTYTFSDDVKQEIIEFVKTANARAVLKSLMQPAPITPMLNNTQSPQALSGVTHLEITTQLRASYVSPYIPRM